jgi:hypothetical protein
VCKWSAVCLIVGGLQFTVSGDDEVSVWADGQYIGNHKGWTTTTVFNIRANTSTLGEYKLLML